MDYEERAFIAENQLNAANKAIVVLSEALTMYAGKGGEFAIEALTTNADTIKRAKESV